VSFQIIAAMDRNRGIGLNNKMPWRLPADFAYVKQVTMGHTLLMGRKTFESIGKPLPGRDNVIMTQRTDYRPEGCEIVHSVEEALAAYQGKEVFIFGGAEIYKQFLPYADRMYITEIDHEFEVDTYFPEVNMSDWTEVSRTQGVKDEKNPYNYAFVVYERQKRE
jgi:dihydrofolate reductase